MLSSILEKVDISYPNEWGSAYLLENLYTKFSHPFFLTTLIWNANVEVYTLRDVLMHFTSSSQPS
eukprot:9155879-Ditylum_brightwellii.AAC.1